MNNATDRRVHPDRNAARPAMRRTICRPPKQPMKMPEDASAKRRQLFIDAATEAFFANGYGDTTMSSIAAKVGGSKTTLWTYFPSKEALFAAMVGDIIERHGNALSFDLREDEDMGLVLKRFGSALMTSLLSEPILNLHRIVVGESKRFPHLAKLFYELGPRRGKLRLAGYFARVMDKGIMRRGDPAVAAQQFTALCQAGTYQLAIMNLSSQPQQAQLGSDIELAVATFYSGWASDQ